MTIKLQLYKCNVCGNLVQILQEGDGNLICCGQEMELMNVQYDSNELGEKHTPKVNIEQNTVDVIGHPMTKDHYIQFIETFTDDKKEVHIKFFSPDELPEKRIGLNGIGINAIEYCNIHKLWGSNRMLNNEEGKYPALG